MASLSKIIDAYLNTPFLLAMPGFADLAPSTVGASRYFDI